MAHAVFISHSSTDKPVADAICATLESASLRCWVAPRDVQPGRSFAGEITRAIQNSKAMVLVFSAHSNSSEQVLREVQLAAQAHLHIVQFRIEDVLLNDDLAYFLSTPHWLDALTPPIEHHLDRLATAMQSLLGPVDDVSAQKIEAGVAKETLRFGRPSHVVPRTTKNGQPISPESLYVALGKRKRLLAAALTTLLVIGVVGGWWFGIRQDRTDAQFQERVANQGRNEQKNNAPAETQGAREQAGNGIVDSSVSRITSAVAPSERSGLEVPDAQPQRPIESPQVPASLAGTWEGTVLFINNRGGSPTPVSHTVNVSPDQKRVTITWVGDRNSKATDARTTRKGNVLSWKYSAHLEKSGRWIQAWTTECSLRMASENEAELQMTSTWSKGPFVGMPLRGSGSMQRRYAREGEARKTKNSLATIGAATKERPSETTNNNVAPPMLASVAARSDSAEQRFYSAARQAGDAARAELSATETTSEQPGRPDTMSSGAKKLNADAVAEQIGVATPDQLKAAFADISPLDSGAMRNSPEGIPDGSIFGITDVTITENPDAETEANLTLRVGVKARSNTLIDHMKVKIQVYFYDTVDSNKMALTDAEVSYQWITPNHDWKNTNPEILSVGYVRLKNGALAMKSAAVTPPGAGRKTRSPKQPVATNSTNRKYFGYQVRVYYMDQLQDVRAEPTKLLNLFPPPLTLATP